jgi:4-amino-4-deoxy-L-arabinose transferase-like glycosyltransferase
MSLGYLWTDFTYDEAVYLRLARTIAETGLPLRRDSADFSRFPLFGNSPPLVPYVAAISQALFPGNEVPARLVHVGMFVLPTYALVWWTARVKFGAWAALASLLALLTSGSYMRATSRVLLDVPLGLLAFAGLVAFYHAACSPVRARAYSVAAALALGLAVVTKYQAVCVAAAITAYVAYTVATRGFAGLRPMLLPLSVMAMSGAAATMTLVWFFWAFGGVETVTGTLMRNLGRITPASIGTVELLRAVLETARECLRTLGGPVLLLAAFTVCAEHRHRGLVVLLGSYVAATIAFNLTVFRLPGAGENYLHSAVPALALLAGTGAARIVQLAATTTMCTLMALAVIAIQIAGSPLSPYQPPGRNGSRVAAAYIAAHSPPGAGVLAETLAIEFYSGRPVRAIGLFSRSLLLRALDGTSKDGISFVVIDAAGPPRNVDAVRQEWDALLANHFELVPAGAPGLHVYSRRTP